jgi:DNA-binding IclR family transcriptional regulator
MNPQARNHLDAFALLREQHEPVTTREVADALGWYGGAATRALRRLVRDGAAINVGNPWRPLWVAARDDYPTIVGTRARILDALAEGPATAAELAQRADRSERTVRGYLPRLVAEGLAQRFGGCGPAAVWGVA